MITHVVFLILFLGCSSAGSAKGSVFCHIYNFILLYSSVPLLELLIWARSSVWESVRFASVRSRVRSPSGPPRRSKVRFAPAYFLAKISRPPAPLLLLFAKSHARLTCSVASALTTVRCRYQLFASCVGVSPPAKTVKTSPPQAAYRLRRLFCKSRRVRSLRCSSFPKKVTPRLRCSLAGALATLRLATNLFRAARVQFHYLKY